MPIYIPMPPVPLLMAFRMRDGLFAPFRTLFELGGTPWQAAQVFAA